MSGLEGHGGGLPGVSTPMFGRADELAAVLAALDDPSVRLVTLTGRGGVGKTRLALEVAQMLTVGDGPATTVVALAGINSVDLVLPEVAKALGVPPSPSDTPDELVAARLGNDDHVLVLDNLEHLVGASSRLSALLDRCSGLRILATSQAPLRLRRERVIHVLPLAAPVIDDVVRNRTIDQSQPSVATYLASARSADAHFDLRHNEFGAVAELCNRLEGLPLAISLAGARAGSLRPLDIIRCLDQVGIGVLSRPRADEPARHHDLGAAIGWTYDLLPVAQQRLLGTLAVGAGAFSIETVLATPTEEPAATVLDHLSALVDLHLVEPVSTPGLSHFSIAGSIRDYALARAEAEGLLADLRRRFVAGWAEPAHRAAEGFEADESPRFLESGSMGDGLLSALEVALDDGYIDDALDLVRVLAERWDTYGYHRVHEGLLDRCLAEADRSDADPLRHARTLARSAMVGLRHSSTRSTGELLERLRRAEAMGEEIADDGIRLFTLTVWLLTFPITGDVEEATRAAKLGLDLASQPANRRWLGSIRVWAGMLALHLGDVDRAVELGRAALDDARQSGDRAAVVRTALLLSPITSMRPDLLAQVPSNQEALEIAQSTGQPLYQAILEARLLFEAVIAGDGPRALEWAERSLLRGRAMQGSPFVAFQISGAASALAMNGASTTAARLEGRLRSVSEFLDAHDSGPGAIARRSRLDGLRAALGDEAFEAEALRGESSSWPEAVEMALDAVRELRSAATTPTEEVSPMSPRSEAAARRLTVRQGEVLRLLALGRSNKDIATELNITAKTVMHHTTAIYRALGVRGRNEAAAWAFRSGFLDRHEPSDRS